MKHGKKSEQKSAKTRKESGSAAKGRGKETVRAGKAQKPASAKASKAGPIGKTAAKKEAASPPRPAATDAPRKDGRPEFTNPLVGSAFSRAIKKYPNAFKRLTD